MSVCGPGVVDEVSVTRFAVFARVDGWPYILNPDEVVSVFPAGVVKDAEEDTNG